MEIKSLFVVSGLLYVSKIYLYLEYNPFSLLVVYYGVIDEIDSKTVFKIRKVKILFLWFCAVPRFNADSAQTWS